jgi:sulfur-oxidizing protein SoxA
MVFTIGLALLPFWARAEKQFQTLLSGNQFLTPQLQAMQLDADANPITLWIEKGQTLWRNTCQSCHNAPETLRTSAAQHPRLITQQHAEKPKANSATLVNLEDQINLCRQRAGQNPKGLEDDDTLALSALLHSVAKGQKINVQPPADVAGQQRWQAELTQGAQLYITRIGRLNLACMHCHDGKVGANLRAEVVSPGHPSGFPIYRLNWQNMGSIDRRLRACYSGVQATLPLAGSPPLRQLELYLKVRANGMPLDGPSIRR